MESLIVAVVSLLILLPILYLLPLGFTGKGKVIIAVAAFLIGLFGLVAESVFALWQTGLILLLVVAGVSYLMHKQGEKWFYLAAEGVRPAVEEKPKSVPVQEVGNAYSYIAHSDKVVGDKELKQYEEPQKFEAQTAKTEEENNTQGEISLQDNSMLGKLIPQNQRELSYFKKAIDDEDDYTENNNNVVAGKDLTKNLNDELPELEIQPIAELDIQPIEELDIRPVGEFDDQPIDELNDQRRDENPRALDELFELDEIEPIEYNPEKPKRNSNPLDVTEELDMEIDALLNDAVNNLEEEKKSKAKLEDSDDYLSEIEKLLEEEHQTTESSQKQLEKEVPATQVQFDDDFELEELIFADENPLQLDKKNKNVVSETDKITKG